MSKHAAHAMHENSLAAYQEEGAKLGARQMRIMELFEANKEGLTDRDVLKILKRNGEAPEDADMNYVRPRLTEILKLTLERKLRKGIREFDTTKDTVTGKTVRICKLWIPEREPVQLDLI